MAIRFSRESAEGGKGKRHITLTTSPSGLVGLVTVLLLCFVWVFVFGLLVGRGYQPEETLPELKHIMPAPPSARKDAGASAPPKAAGPTSQTAAQSGTDASGIIKPEELTYYEQLKAREIPRKPVPSRPAPAAQRTDTPETTRQASAPQTSVAPDKERYDYVYQVASFRDRPSADSLRTTIESAGLTSRVESGEASGSTWYRVMVLFRGTPEATRNMKETLARLGINKPLMKSKTAVPGTL